MCLQGVVFLPWLVRSYFNIQHQFSPLESSPFYTYNSKSVAARFRCESFHRFCVYTGNVRSQCHQSTMFTVALLSFSHWF